MLPKALAFLVVAFLSATARAASPANCQVKDAHQAIQQIENQWINASEMPPAARLRFFEQVLAPDGIHIVDSGQRYTHREILDYYRRHPQPASKPRATFKHLNIRVYGDVAIANGTTEITGPQPADQHQDRFTDVFEKRAGRWVAVNEQETRVSSIPAAHH